MSRKYDAVLFDFDGTLARTMEDNLRAWQAALSHTGIQVGGPEYFALEGLPVREIVKRLFEMGGRPDASADEMAEAARMKDVHYLKNHRIEFYPGVDELTLRLREAGVPIAIVTAGQEARIRGSVSAEFLSRFSGLVTGDMTARGKPYPDPFLKGAEVLGLDPHRCWVVENAPLGIQAAKSAGTHCLAVCSTLPRAQLQEADVVVDRFSDLFTVLGFEPLLR